MNAPFWDPRDEADDPSLTVRKLLGATPRAVLGVLIIAGFIALFLILAGVSPGSHPGWW